MQGAGHGDPGDLIAVGADRRGEGGEALAVRAGGQTRQDPTADHQDVPTVHGPRRQPHGRPVGGQVGGHRLDLGATRRRARIEDHRELRQDHSHVLDEGAVGQGVGAVEDHRLRAGVPQGLGVGGVLGQGLGGIDGRTVQISALAALHVGAGTAEDRTNHGRPIGACRYPAVCPRRRALTTPRVTVTTRARMGIPRGA